MKCAPSPLNPSEGVETRAMLVLAHVWVKDKYSEGQC
jgi:hypothetical protein